MASTKHLIIATDLNGVVTFFNKASEIALDYKAKDVVGKHSPALWHDREEVGKRAGELSKILKREIKPGFDVFTAKPNIDGSETREWTFIRKDGSRFPVSLTVTGILNKNEEVIGYLGVIEDISERKKNEEKMRGLFEELKASNDELEKFGYICSHDLQEPLRMIRSFSQLFKNHLQEKIENDEQANKYMNIICDGAERAQNLISDVLMYSSVNSNQEIEFEEINLQKVINEIKKDIAILLKSSKATIIYDNLPLIRGHKTQITQLFYNLISNGIKFQHLNTIPIIEIKSRDDGNFWHFSVLDNGIGIKSEYLNKIFDIFHRLHSKSEYDGTGIGLSICKKITEFHGGKIWVESTQGKGSIFHFTIPKTL